MPPAKSASASLTLAAQTPIEPDATWIESLRADLPELPAARRSRYVADLGVDARQAALVGASPEWAGFFDRVVALGADPRAAANWLTGDLAGLLNESKTELAGARVTPQHLADLLVLLAAGDVSSAGAKSALGQAFATGAPIAEIVEASGLRQVSDAAALEAIVQEVIAENPGPVAQFRGGKDGAINALVGQVMKRTRGSANPSVAADLLRARLST